MDIYVLDSHFDVIDVIDTYESFIWTERYIECGDFELYINYEKRIFDDVKNGIYLQIESSNTLMIIEDITTEKPSPDSAVKLVVTGRCLKSLLYRRIIWGQKVFDESQEYFELESVVKSLITDAIIIPKKILSIKENNVYKNYPYDAPERKIDNFHFVEKNINDKDYTTVKSAKIKNTQFDGENLGEAVISLCASQGIGLKIDFDDGNFYCTLIGGLDHSYDNVSNNDYVVFSPDFDNLANTNFKMESKEYKNVTIIIGREDAEGTIEDERLFLVEGDDVSGINRREIITDCSGVSDSKSVWDPNEGSYTDEPINEDEFVEMLREKGKENLSKNDIVKNLEGEIINHIMYEYGVDYSLGDIVETEDEYGNKARSRVMEYIQCQDANGFQTYPTFSSVVEEEDNNAE